MNRSLIQACIIASFAACGGSGNGAPDAPGQLATDAPDVDAAVDAFSPVTCGGALCRSDQSCVDNKCTFACAGNTVPGDYASLQTAVDALAAADRDATICVGEATFNEGSGGLAISDSGNHGHALTIIGLSPDRSKIISRVGIGSGWASITIKGMGFSPPTSYPAIESYAPTTDVSLIGSKLAGSGGIQISQKASWLIDGTDITADTNEAVVAYVNDIGTSVVRIRNSFLHGAGSGVSTQASGGRLVQLELVNDTFVGQQVGVDLIGAATATIANSLFTGMTDHALSWTGNATVTRHHNALWNNAANYSGLGSDGANTMKVDCQLGTQTIPELAAGSPCLAAGDASVAPPSDFYGTTRGSPPDLGAVESP